MATNTITALGAGSGVDTAALAKSLVDAERAPAKAIIDKRITSATNSVSGYAAIKFVLDNLKTAFADLKDQSDFASIAPTISQSSALSVAAGATTPAGSHTVTVTTLAAAQRNISAGFAAATSLNDGAAFNLKLSVHGGAEQTIAVTEPTVAGIAAAINNANLGISASLVNTGNASTPYKIVVTGTTGVANDFTLTSDNVPSCVTAVTTQGDNARGVTESTALSFTALKAGQSVTIGGLTYTATLATTAEQLAAAFASLSAGATTGAGTATGSYSGTLTGFATGAVTGSTVTATSSTANADVTDLAITNTGFSLGTKLQAACNATLNVDGVDITSSSNQVQRAITGATLNLISTTSGAATLNFTRDTASVKTKLQALVTAYKDANSMLGTVSDPKSTVPTYGATLVGNSIVSQVRDQIRNLVLGESNSTSGTIKALRNLGISVDKTGVLTLDSTTLDAALSSNFDQAVTMLTANRENLSSYSTLSAGLAGEAVKKLTTMLASDGAISTQSANATKKISDYNTDLTKLEARMTLLLERYNKQFATMDSLVGQSNSLRTSLTSTFAGMSAMYTNK
ncbi:MAG: flagellar filament capping protein FliD [Comamonadaceae bacterium]